MFIAAIPGWEQLIEGITYVLKYLYEFTGNFGIAIILLTIGMRILLFPLTYKQTKSMIAMQRLMPQMKEIQKKYKDDREKQGQEMMALYKEHKVSPFSSCLPMLLQLPIMFAVFEVLRNLSFTIKSSTLLIDVPKVIRILAPGGYDYTSKTLAKNVPQIVQTVAPGNQMFMFLGMDLRHAGPQLWKSGDYAQIIIMIVLTLVTGFISSAMMTGDDKQSKMMMRVMPLMFGVFAWILPAGVTLYIIITNILTIIQQYFQLEREGFYDEKKANRYKTGEPLNWMEKLSFKTTDYGSKVMISLKLKPEPKKKVTKSSSGKAKAAGQKTSSGKDRAQAKKSSAGKSSSSSGASSKSDKKKVQDSGSKNKSGQTVTQKPKTASKPKPESVNKSKNYPAKKKK